MMLYLVRHAKAGSRSEWDGEDEVRPLSRVGHRQAELIGRRLGKREVTTLVSSPYVRCVQTLEPLAQLCSEPVHTDDRLSEGSDVHAVLELLGALPDGAVLCSHGDVIPDTMKALERRGCEFTSEPDWRKGSVWALKRGDDGAITSARAWPPPST